MSDIAEKAWDKVYDKKAGDASWEESSPAHKAKLQSVVDELRRTNTSSGIAGLEEFEREAGKLLKVDVQPSQGLDAAATGEGPTVNSGVEPAQEERAGGAEGSAKPQPKGSGAQEPVKNPLASAAAAGSRVEADEVNSPSRGSAARILGAEAPGGGFNPGEEKATSKGKKSSGKKSAATKGGTKK
jgi:hypothetical protein